VLAAGGAAVAVDRGEPRSFIAMLRMGERFGRPAMANPVPPAMMGSRLMDTSVAHAEIVHAFMDVAVAEGDVSAPVMQMHAMEPGVAGFGGMRPRERRSDLKSRGKHEGERAGESGGLDETTVRRVVMFQYAFLSRFVAVQVHQPVEAGERACKGTTFDVTLAWRCRG
jgi:hypothetical protein